VFRADTERVHLLLQIGGYLIAAVFIAHVVYFLGCFVVMALCAVASPFVWLWQQLHPERY
jgi:hypothetical protein